MGTHQAALFEPSTLPGSGDRLCRAMVGSQYYSSARLLCGADYLRIYGDRKRFTPIRGEATPSRGEDDDPKYPLFRQHAQGGACTSTSSIHQQLRSIAKSTTAKTKGFGMNETATNEKVEGNRELLESQSMYCDVQSHPLFYQFMYLALKICDEVDSEFKLDKSKKPQRLSTTSSDFLD